MAQKVQVLDIGSYSAKSVAVRVPFVGFSVSGVQEAVCPSALEPKTRRADQHRAAQGLLPGKRLAGDAITVVMPAEKTLNRFLDMPFSDRAKIDSVLAFELENHVPLSTGEFQHDYVVMEKSKEGARLFVSLVPDKDIAEQQEMFESFDIDPRVLVHQAVAHARLSELTSEPPSERAAFIEVGHRKTLITLVEKGRFAGCRIIMHGGYDLTRALAEQFSSTVEEAEREKHEGHLFPAGEGMAVGRKQDAADCLLDALKPLIRDLRQTFKSHGEVDELYLFGGGARLGGLDQCLASALNKQVTVLYPSMLKMSYGVEQDGLQFVSAIAAGYAGQKGSDAQRVNFRQGDFVYEGDFKYVRGRLIYLAIFAVVMLTAFVAPQVMRYRSVMEQEEFLRLELGELSVKILGEELEDWDEVLDRLDEMPPAEVWTVFPDLTAHEVYWEVADIVGRIDGQPTGEVPRELPVADKAEVEGADANAPGTTPPVGPDGVVPGGPEGGPPESPLPGGPEALAKAEPDPGQDLAHHLELNEIRIDGASRTSIGEGMVEFTGNASSVATMELFLSTVSQHPCFRNVQRTKQEILKATKGKEGWWRFKVDFTVSCPRKTAMDIMKSKEAESKKLDEETTPPDQLDPKTGTVPGAAQPGDSAGKPAPANGAKTDPAAVPNKAQPAPAKDRPGPGVDRENGADQVPGEDRRGEERRKDIERRANEARARAAESRNGARTGSDRAADPGTARGESAPIVDVGRGTRLLNRPARKELRGSQPLMPKLPSTRLKRHDGEE